MKIIFSFESCQLINRQLKFSFAQVVKKILTIVLILVYSLSAFGMSVKYHYCMDRLTSISMDFGVHQDCKCNTSANTEGCCKDKVLCFKGDNHKVYQILQSNPMEGLQIEPPVSLAISLFKDQKEAFYLPGEIVQDNSPHPLFLLNRTFRI